MADVSTDRAGDAKALRRTAPPEARRTQLIQATIESIGKHGFSGTTMKTVTGIAGLSMGIVNFHFKNKETLFEETLRYLGEEHRDHWHRAMKNAGPRPQDKMIAIVEAHFHDDISNRKKLAVWFAFYGEATSRAAYREIMSELDDERWKISTALLADVIAEGGYHNINAEEVSDTLEGLYDGFCLNILMYPGVFTRGHATARVVDYLATLFPQHFERSTAPARA